MGGDQPNDNFATWLFDSPGSHNDAFDFNNVPFLDFGMEYASRDFWSFDQTQSSNVYDGLNNRSYSTPSVSSEQRFMDVVDANPHISISGGRREAIVMLLSLFMMKKKPRLDASVPTDSILYGAESGDWPNLTILALESCLRAFWRDTAAQVPVVHQPTFSANTCEPLLLVAMVALGAAARVRSKPRESVRDYRTFADFIATNLRWELFTHDHAQPPVHLWVAQTLLLLELYEKMHSTRQLHERAHIHHASTLTLLRRGSPMVGRSGSETPPSEAPTRPGSPNTSVPQHEFTTTAKPASDTRSWWKRWVANESMNRVVFAAFQMDTLHACMFGHSADILPHELRLPLPCDDSLWTAKSGQEVRRLENTFAMYRIKQPNFLDGLKRCLHGYEVQTHHFARMILMAGLLSVAWHINRREKHLQFVETIPSVQEQARWKSLLLQAFGHWRQSFSEVLGDTAHRSSGGSRDAPARDASDPTTLFHLAHLTMHVDIIDIQILSGPKRLIGRRVSDKDRASVLQRVKAWASSSVARHATLHAFKLLQATLCRSSNGGRMSDGSPGWTYSCRNDPFVYRPWILYLAGLTVWAYQYATSQSNNTPINTASFTTTGLPSQSSAADLAKQYISSCAVTDNEDRIPMLLSQEGCIAILHILAQDFVNAEAEILLEASKRVQECIRLLKEQAKPG
ncbi:hypothetical protein LTR37_021205 [Vermiconidia calcicola]|uniref:Uncharacterized protein n=1 Tax=Vermiconidia calcicola TaxID=1690605 RepID=A0ACC3MAG3_9PEZI|nr:hypothetical protein LTR37_021205 [Vermiconidia calcicola]